MKRIAVIFFSALLFVAANLKAEVNDSLTTQETTNTTKILDIEDSIVYSKLSSMQIVSLKNQDRNLEKRKLDQESRLEMERIRLARERTPLNGFGIVLVVFIPFAFVILVLILLIRHKNKESQRKFDLYSKSLEMGQNIPEHFFEEPKKIQKSNLRKGILWLAVGLGFLIFAKIIEWNTPEVLGIIPKFAGIISTFVGLGFILIHFLDKPKKTDEQNG